MVIFIKPKDIPSDETKDMVEENFHDKIEKLRLQIQQEPEFFDFDEVKKTPKLIEKKKLSNKKAQK